MYGIYGGQARKTDKVKCSKLTIPHKIKYYKDKEFNMTEKVKKLGQVYTPINIVNDMLNFIGYSGERILQKHIIDNSCGNGAFLKKIVEIYIEEYKKKYNTLIGIENDLNTYIHGIEIDNEEYNKCIQNLHQIAFWHGISEIDWDVIHDDAIICNKYDGKMDFVIGNPPYVRIHNLENNFEKIRNYEFCKKGMTDLYILFYEIGFKMLNKTGKLCYITPNSFYSSNAGFDFRNYIIETKHLAMIADLGHYQPFKASTYTTICLFNMNDFYEFFDYYKYDQTGKLNFEEKLNLRSAFNNGKMILARKREQNLLKDIQNYAPKNPNIIEVKNGFATLADKIFISKNETKDSIKVVKASTGKWYHCIFPYDDKLKVISFDKLSIDTQKHLTFNELLLKKRNLDKNADWYCFGRSQAIKDVFQKKYSINTTIKDISSIKINEVKSGEGVFSGLYIIGNINKKMIELSLKNEDFIEYIKTLGKCKSGGYYTFSSTDLKKYLIYKLENANE